MHNIMYILTCTLTHCRWQWPDQMASKLTQKYIELTKMAPPVRVKQSGSAAALCGKATQTTISTDCGTGSGPGSPSWLIVLNTLPTYATTPTNSKSQILYTHC